MLAITPGGAGDFVATTGTGFPNDIGVAALFCIDDGAICVELETVTTDGALIITLVAPGNAAETPLTRPLAAAAAGVATVKVAPPSSEGEVWPIALPVYSLALISSSIELCPSSRLYF